MIKKLEKKLEKLREKRSQYEDYIKMLYETQNQLEISYITLCMTTKSETDCKIEPSDDDSKPIPPSLVPPTTPSAPSAPSAPIPPPSAPSAPSAPPAPPAPVPVPITASEDNYPPFNNPFAPGYVFAENKKKTYLTDDFGFHSKMLAEIDKTKHCRRKNDPEEKGEGYKKSGGTYWSAVLQMLRSIKSFYKEHLLDLFCIKPHKDARKYLFPDGEHSPSEVIPKLYPGAKIIELQIPEINVSILKEIPINKCQTVVRRWLDNVVKNKKSITEEEIQFLIDKSSVTREDVLKCIKHFQNSGEEVRFRNPIDIVIDIDIIQLLMENFTETTILNESTPERIKECFKQFLAQNPVSCDQLTVKLFQKYLSINSNLTGPIRQRPASISKCQTTIFNWWISTVEDRFNITPTEYDKLSVKLVGLLTRDEIKDCVYFLDSESITLFINETMTVYLQWIQNLKDRILSFKNKPFFIEWNGNAPIFEKLFNYKLVSVIIKQRNDDTYCNYSLRKKHWYKYYDEMVTDCPGWKEEVIAASDYKLFLFIVK